ncbi:hypothetical protein [Stenotrophomonas maltophilia]|uniref:hypothetical protein n=1 Tax=Stenotrophomonas maltophilia TaxID=40324 RepID=UPI0018D48FF2|nr:hypothetical protein [Stenotrophomonas maltophilia]MBH1458058.1 hypothetical protein [Stenotrophomonas maltophilia]MBN5095714.1 hypothetical protein [Stenotrophomonas maltophilia]
MTTDNKTLAVDVLAVMDHESDRIEERIGYGLADDLRDARAAVAELIEALDLAAYGEYLPESVEQQIRTSLARVKGESA